MAEIGNERWGEFKLNVLKILAKYSEGIHANKVFEELDQMLPPTEYEKTYFDRTGVQRRNHLVRFSTIALVKAGWMTKEKGLWAITDEGRTAIQKFSTPDAIKKESDRLYRAWKASQPEVEDDDEEIVDVNAAVSIEEAESNAFSIVDSYFANMPPYEFQNLIGALLTGLGYYVSWIAPPGKDGGVDIIAFQDPLGAIGPRIKVQVKRQQGTVGVDVVRSFLGVLSDKDDIGLFVSLGGFSSDAEKEARNHSSKRLTLIDSKKLFDMWISVYDKLTQEQRNYLPLRAVYYLDNLD